MWYFKTNTGIENGPVTSLELKNLVMNGHITASTPIRKEDMLSWVLAKDVKGLNAHAATTVSAQANKTAAKPYLDPFTAPISEQQSQTKESPLAPLIPTQSDIDWQPVIRNRFWIVFSSWAGFLFSLIPAVVSGFILIVMKFDLMISIQLGIGTAIYIIMAYAFHLFIKSKSILYYGLDNSDSDAINRALAVGCTSIKVFGILYMSIIALFPLAIIIGLVAGILSVGNLRF